MCGKIVPYNFKFIEILKQHFFIRFDVDFYRVSYCKNKKYGTAFVYRQCTLVSKYIVCLKTLKKKFHWMPEIITAILTVPHIFIIVSIFYYYFIILAISLFIMAAVIWITNWFVLNLNWSCQLGNMVIRIKLATSHCRIIT